MFNGSRLSESYLKIVAITMVLGIMSMVALRSTQAQDSGCGLLAPDESGLQIAFDGFGSNNQGLDGVCVELEMLDNEVTIVLEDQSTVHGNRESNGSDNRCAITVSTLEGANIRSAPSLDATIVATRAFNEQLTAFGWDERGLWLQVFINGYEAWVMSPIFYYVQDDCDRLPIVSSPSNADGSAGEGDDADNNESENTALVDTNDDGTTTNTGGQSGDGSTQADCDIFDLDPICITETADETAEDNTGTNPGTTETYQEGDETADSTSDDANNTANNTTDDANDTADDTTGDANDIAIPLDGVGG